MRPALLRRRWSRPNVSTARLTACSALPSSVTSATSGSRPGLARLSTAGSMSSATTLAPRAWSNSTIARPMPLAAPVTIATLSFTSVAGLQAMGGSCLVVRRKMRLVKILILRNATDRILIKYGDVAYPVKNPQKQWTALGHRTGHANEKPYWRHQPRRRSPSRFRNNSADSAYDARSRREGGLWQPDRGRDCCTRWRGKNNDLPPLAQRLGNPHGPLPRRDHESGAAAGTADGARKLQGLHAAAGEVVSRATGQDPAPPARPGPAGRATASCPPKPLGGTPPRGRPGIRPSGNGNGRAAPRARSRHRSRRLVRSVLSPAAGALRWRADLRCLRRQAGRHCFPGVGARTTGLVLLNGLL